MTTTLVQYLKKVTLVTIQLTGKAITITWDAE